MAVALTAASRSPAHLVLGSPVSVRWLPEHADVIGRGGRGSPVVDFAVTRNAAYRSQEPQRRRLVRFAMAAEENLSDDLGLLMRAAQDGDRVAYRELLREIVPVLRRVLKRRFPFLPHQDVEDLVQDILLSVHAVRATYDPARPFPPWLMAIARNRTADMARRYARRNAREVAVDTYPETPSDDETNTGEPFGDAGALQQAMKALPQGQRTAIELLKLRELSLKEAATVSGMSVTALKVATHRATRALRLMLKANETVER